MCGDPARDRGACVELRGNRMDDAADVDDPSCGRAFFSLRPRSPVAIEEIVAISRAHKITTLTGVPEYVEKGIALGLTLRAERPAILVDLNGARAEGANFNSQLLKIARVVSPEPVARQALQPAFQAGTGP